VCEKAWLKAIASVGSDGIGDATQAAILCQIAAKTRPLAVAALVGTGEINVTQHGNSGAVTDIEAGINLLHVTLAIAYANVGSVAAVGTSAFTSTSAQAGEICELTAYPVLCAKASAATESFSTASGTAIAVANSFSAAGSDGIHSAGVQVEGKNLQKFTATLNALASSFALADVNALAEEAYAVAFIDVFLESFAQVCEKVYSYNCDAFGAGCVSSNSYTEVCNAAFISVSNTIESIATAFGEAEAEAFAISGIQIQAVLEFERTPGNPQNNNIVVSAGGEDSALASAHVQCDP
jgi:hypothetical protein